MQQRLMQQFIYAIKIFAATLVLPALSGVLAQEQASGRNIAGSRVRAYTYTKGIQIDVVCDFGVHAVHLLIQCSYSMSGLWAIAKCGQCDQLPPPPKAIYDVTVASVSNNCQMYWEHRQDDALESMLSTEIILRFFVRTRSRAHVQ